MVYKTREKLIEVARQLFVHKGLENTTMNDIANASEKGRRTIYTYFKNKKEIYNAVLEHESDKMVAGMKEIADSALDPATKLTGFLMLRLEHGALISSPYSIIKSLFKLDLRRMARMRRKVIDKESIMLSSILEEGISKGVFDRERALLAESFILRCISGMDLAEIDDQSANDLPAIQKRFVDFLVSDLTEMKTETNNLNNNPLKTF